MLPVFLALLGTPYRTGARLFMGWFGKRGRIPGIGVSPKGHSSAPM
jgi:NhaP-type Na+/H+ or K+/H+ antiporter